MVTRGLQWLTSRGFNQEEMLGEEEEPNWKSTKMIPLENLEDEEEGYMICFSIWVGLLHMQKERS